MIGEKILIVDDDMDICEIIALYIEKERMVPLIACDRKEALSILEEYTVDLIILDVMLPDSDGYELCMEIRKNSNVPIIFLSSKGEEIDKILALTTGGDDYVTKPFMPGELMARIKANIRRSKMAQGSSNKQDMIRIDDVVIYPSSHEVFVSEQKVNLSAKEFDLMLVMAKNPNRVFSAEQLFQLVWKDQCIEGDSGTVMVHISRLRKKMEKDPSLPDYILTVKGVGYKFANPM